MAPFGSRPAARNPGLSRSTPYPRRSVTDLGYSLASLVLRRLPARATDPLIHVLSHCYVLTHPRRARAVDRNLAWLWTEARREGGAPPAGAAHRPVPRP